MIGEEGEVTGMDTWAEMTEDTVDEEKITGGGDLHLHIGGGEVDPDLSHQEGRDIDGFRVHYMCPRFNLKPPIFLNSFSVFH